MKRIAIQGIAGCFHDTAARNFFAGERIEVLPCPSFDELFARMGTDRDLLGIAAIENTIAGSLLPNHELLRLSSARIIGEQKLRISHVLAALPGQRIGEIREVHSHPIALMQCGEFLKAHPGMKAVERDDTAGSAREIAREGLTGTAAICGAEAAERYGLEILERGIETNRHNFTRFLLLADESRAAEFARPGRPDKASLLFTLPHTQGSLSKALTVLSFYDINLTKIQSLPIVGREWEYRFYVDVTFADPERFLQAVEAVRPLTSGFRILGEYAECPNPKI
ncbi:prephenate dehydratase [uncultured Alistipes sp.]|uniref:prephenate dehydratase n=1 Tax=uncultured Alistipes sp. TaxID=538949 RepID=UPI00262F0E03|nr:prephenate dehydratase [uncultured Alistipes sp.]